MDYFTIGVVVSVVVVCLLFIMLMYVLTTYYLHHGFSSGNWFNKKGDVLVVRNRGVLGNSQLKIGARDDGNYDVVKYNCRMLINPLSMPHKFTMYIRGSDNMHAVINMLTGKMKLYKDGVFYDEFAKSNIL